MATPVRSDADRRVLVERFFSGTGASYDQVVRAATLGIDRRWKRVIVDAIPHRASRILDLACGTGILTLDIARRFPDARVVGVELRDEYLAHAREKIAERRIANVELVLSAAEDYESPEPFDAVVSSYLGKYADLSRLTRNTHAILRPGGLVLMHDFTYPPSRALAAVWRAYLAALRLVGTPLLPSWREIFDELPGLIESTRWLEELTGALERECFEAIETRYLTLCGSAVVTARKPARRGSVT